MGCGVSKADIDIDNIDPETATLAALKSKVKKLRKEAEKPGVVEVTVTTADGATSSVLDRFVTLLSIKEELHAEPKPAAKGYLDVTIPLADLSTETKRLRNLEVKAKAVNILTADEQTALQARLGLLEQAESGKAAMQEATDRPYTSKMSVSELRTHAAGQDETRNKAIGTLTLTVTIKAGEASYAEKTPEYAQLGKVMAAVNAMAHAKEGLASATAKGVTVVEGETSLDDARAALAQLKTACEAANAALAHEAPEMPPCKEQLMRVGVVVSKVEMRLAAAVPVDAQTNLKETREAAAQLTTVLQAATFYGTDTMEEYQTCEARLQNEVGPILALKERVHDAAHVGHPKMPVAQLLGEVTAQMEAEREAADLGGAFGGDVAQELECRMHAIAEMANAKLTAEMLMSCTVSSQASVESLKSETMRLQEVISGLEVAADTAPELEALKSFIAELHKAIQAKDAAQKVIAASQAMLLAPLSSGAKAAFTGTKIEGCKRCQVVSGKGNSLTVVPIDWHGKQKTVKVQKGTDKDGKPKYVNEPKHVGVDAAVCVVASVEALEKQQHVVADALKGVKALVKSGGIFSKGTKLSEGGSPNEIAELQELHAMLTKGCQVSKRHCSATAKRSAVEQHAWQDFARAGTEAAQRWQIEVAEVADKKYASNKKYGYFSPQSAGTWATVGYNAFKPMLTGSESGYAHLKAFVNQMKLLAMVTGAAVRHVEHAKKVEAPGACFSHCCVCGKSHRENGGTMMKRLSSGGLSSGVCSPVSRLSRK